MGCVKCLYLLVAIAAIVAIAIEYLSILPDVPEIEEASYWGPGAQPRKADTSIRPFKINVSDEVLLDLKNRLDNTRSLTTPLEGVQQQYGMNTILLGEILDFWRNKYEWREREKFLNKFPQFLTNIHGLDVHYLHVKPKPAEGVQVLPLLLLHGWSGSVREFYGIIPLLTEVQGGKNIVFEVIAPSLPGHGFSAASSKPGLSATQMAVMLKNLMLRLGFAEFYVQGGDWGAYISANIARLYPAHVLGLHSTFCVVDTLKSRLKMLLGSLYPSAVVRKEFRHKMYPLSDFYANFWLETAYAHIQATKPETIGIALTDSPAGLAAYLLEKFSTWTNDRWRDRLDGGLTEKFTYTDLLDNVMIYWATNSITTSMRIYAETFNRREYSLGHQLTRVPIKVPSACMRTINEIVYQPDWILKEIFVNMVQSNDYDDGGHFAAFEIPRILAEDLYSAVSKMQNLRAKSEK